MPILLTTKDAHLWMLLPDETCWLRNKSLNLKKAMRTEETRILLCLRHLFLLLHLLRDAAYPHTLMQT